MYTTTQLPTDAHRSSKDALFHGGGVCESSGLGCLVMVESRAGDLFSFCVQEYIHDMTLYMYT